MKLKLTFIGNEAPRIELESETVGDFLVLRSMADLEGFTVVGFESVGPYIEANNYGLDLRGNQRHSVLKLLPSYKPKREEP